MESELEALCRHYIDQLEGENAENALHSMMELPTEALSILMSFYRTQESHLKKRDIVHSIWQHRDKDTLGFLLGILEKEENESIWQETLDGIIALKGSSELLQLKIKESRKASSIREAIEFIEGLNA